MADLLQRGEAWLAEQRDRFLAHEVHYQRGAVGVVLRATVGRTAFQVDTGTGIVERVEARDYLIDAAQLSAAGIALPPQRGDRISEDLGGTRWVAEVLAPAGEPPWRWADADRLTLRIHTKLIAAEKVT